MRVIFTAQELFEMRGEIKKYVENYEIILRAPVFYEKKLYADGFYVELDSEDLQKYEHEVVIQDLDFKLFVRKTKRFTKESIFTKIINKLKWRINE